MARVSRLNQFLQHQSGAVYFGILLLNIIGGMFSLYLLQAFTKPLLMPVLMLWIWSVVLHGKNWTLILAALFFSWAGDIFLLFENQWPGMFIPGLASFLITHILYIIYFLNNTKKAIPRIKNFPLLVFLILLYGIILILVLYPDLGDLKIPVILYAVVIMTMLLSAFYLYTSIPSAAGQYFVMGALLFILSDSLLAFNKFLIALGPYSIAIMITYGFAQWFIVKGFIYLHGENRVGR